MGPWFRRTMLIVVHIHLLFAVIYPLAGSELRAQLSPVLQNYVLYTGITSRWALSPETLAQTPHLRYRPLGAAEGDPTSLDGSTTFETWPPEEPGFGGVFPWLYQVRALEKGLTEPTMRVLHFVPWVCGRNPEAERVAVQEISLAEQFVDGRPVRLPRPRAEVVVHRCPRR